MDEFERLRVAFCSPSGASSTHTIYCKTHRVRMNSDLTPNDRTLFTLGWPPYCSKSTIKELFSRAGHVTEVFLQASPGAVDNNRTTPSLSQGQPPGFQIGYVVMSSVDEASSALGLCEADTALPCPLSSSDLGLEKWSLGYAKQRKSMTSLEGDAVGVVNSYDRRQFKERLKEKRRGQQPDEDGWITVTRKRKSDHSQQAPQRKKKKKELVNLYPWQQRETQRQQIAELRQKFEEDKRRVAEMKARRKFKPF